jgi:hypothetical protein
MEKDAASMTPAAAPAEVERHFFVFDKPNGKARFKKPGDDREIVVKPRFFGREVEPTRTETLRDALARAVIGSDLFAKTVVDRTWAQLFGRGIVDPWDDLGGEGDARHPALLVRLADDFRASGHDLKHLLRTIVLSRTYGATSRGAADDAASTAAFARAAVRRLAPEQVFRSLVVATGAERMEKAGAAEMQKKIDRALKEYLFVFADDEMAEIDTFNGNVPQALLVFNGEVTNQGSRARAGGTLAGILTASGDPATRLRRLFLAAYTRPPTGDEAARLMPAGTDRGAWEDLFFALLTSTEMLTNH